METIFRTFRGLGRIKYCSNFKYNKIITVTRFLTIPKRNIFHTNIRYTKPIFNYHNIPAMSIFPIKPKFNTSATTTVIPSYQYLKFSQLGYTVTETKWILSIVNNNENIYNMLLSHTSNSFCYSLAVAGSIKKNGFNEWMKNCLHLGYYDVSQIFYSCAGGVNASNILLSYNFGKNINNEQSLTEFNNKYHKDLPSDKKKYLLGKLITDVFEKSSYD